MVIQYQKNMPLKKPTAAARQKSAEQVAAMVREAEEAKARSKPKSKGGPVKKDTPIANVDSPEKWEPEPEMKKPLSVAPGFGVESVPSYKMKPKDRPTDGSDQAYQARSLRPKREGPFRATAEEAAADSFEMAKAAATKKLLSIRLDADVVDKFKALGKGWQGKINAALRQHLGI